MNGMSLRIVIYTTTECVASSAYTAVINESVTAPAVFKIFPDAQAVNVGPVRIYRSSINWGDVEKQP